MIIYAILNEKYCEVRTGVEKRGQEWKNTFFVTSSATSDAKFWNLIGVKDFTNCVTCNRPGAFFM